MAEKIMMLLGLIYLSSLAVQSMAIGSLLGLMKNLSTGF